MSPPPAEQFAARIFMGPALRAQPDRRLVDLVRDGYDAAFEEIVRRYRRPLDRFAAAFVGHRSEDVTQDSFSKALPALRKSDAEIELRPWLYRIVRNTALNDLRANATPAAELSEHLPGARSTAAEVETREELRDLMDRLQALPETQRAALVMRELEGLSHEEIAAALGVSGGAARQAIFRARATLREGFGLLVPLPVLRALADHGGEAGAAGAGVALGSGALKAGVATVLIAGAVGAGVVVEHHHGHGAGPEAAEAAPPAGGRHPGTRATGAAARQSSLPGSGNSPNQGTRSADSGGGHDGATLALGNGDRSGSGGSRSSGNDSPSGSSSPGGGPGSSGGSGSGDHHGGSSGSDGGSGTSGSDGSGSGESGGSGSSDGSGTSGGSGSDDSLVSSGDGSSSGSGSGEIESEPTATEESTLSDGSGTGDSGSSSGSSDGGGETTSDSGSGDLISSTSTSGSDGSP